MSTDPRLLVLVAVDWTDRSRHADGSFVTWTSFVRVPDGDGDDDPTLVAAQQVGARVVAQFDGMVTATQVTDALA